MLRKTGPGGLRGAEDGLALLSVLWIVMVLALIAAAVLDRSTGDVRLARNVADRARAALAADGAVRLEIARLLAEDGAAWPPDGASREARIGDVAVTARARDETGRVDLNAAPRELLAALALAVGADEPAAQRFADALADYRDADGRRRAAGAEAPDYAAAGLPPPADADLLSPDELAGVLGVGPELARRLAPHVTTYGASPRPDRAASTETVREALAIAAERVARDVGGADAAPPETSDAAEMALEAFRLAAERARRGGRVARITASAVTESGARFIREAVVALRPGDDAEPWTVLSWRQLRDEG